MKKKKQSFTSRLAREEQLPGVLYYETSLFFLAINRNNLSSSYQRAWKEFNHFKFILLKTINCFEFVEFCMVDKVTEMADVFSFVHTTEVKYTPYNGDFIIFFCSFCLQRLKYMLL